MGASRINSPLFPLWGLGSAQYLLEFWWVWLGLVVLLFWVLGQRGLDTGFPQAGQLTTIGTIRWDAASHDTITGDQALL